MKNKGERLFNVIAPIYNLFFHQQVRYYRRILDKMDAVLPLQAPAAVLDVGCGVGALCAVLAERDLQVTGLDVSAKMIQQAEKRLGAYPKVQLHQMSILEKTPFADATFSYALSSYVMHGLSAQQRKQAYQEMKRLTQKAVVIHDYNQTRALMTNVVEWFEGGDYFNFIKQAEEEMREVFPRVETVQVDTRAAWYICRLS